MWLKISLFFVDYARIDPNQSYDEFELLDSGHMIFSKSPKSKTKNELRDMFGTEVSIKTDGYKYDYENIKTSLNFEDTPTSHLIWKNFVLFQNSVESKSVIIPPSTRQAKRNRKRKCKIVYAEKIVDFADSGELYNVIIKEMLKERKISPNLGGIYLLPEKVIRIIAKEKDYEHLEDFCEKESNVFVVFEEV